MEVGVAGFVVDVGSGVPVGDVAFKVGLFAIAAFSSVCSLSMLIPVRPSKTTINPVMPKSRSLYVKKRFIINLA